MRQDIADLASVLGGKVKNSDTRPGIRFRGGEIDPQGQSFGLIVRKLRANGFGNNSALDHPEGFSLQMRFEDGLWYHVIVNYNDPNQVNAYGWPLNPDATTPLITIHCHATDPSGWTHFVDEVKHKLFK